MKTILALHTRHDANLAISQDNEIILYVEFEKISKKRYFSFSEDPKTFERQCLDLIIPFTRNILNIDEIILNWVTNEQEKILKLLFSNVKIWRTANHHISHAWSSYVFTKEREGDLILSYDGGGDLGDFFKIFLYENGKVNLIKEVPINLGRPYRLLGLLSPELYKDRSAGYSMEHALAGKIMALVALGHVVEEYKKPLRIFYEDFENNSVDKNFSKLMSSVGFSNEKFLPLEIARNLLATSQRVFEEIVDREFFHYIKKHNPNRIIICGGCALNVTMNTKISKIFGIEIFISPCPNDCGISLGTLKMFNPNLMMLPKPYSKIITKNTDIIEKEKDKFKFETFNIQRLAELIAEGKVIGTIREYLEIGPRALGNRSYLASPLISGMKNRINTMKGREFWRPVAPIILEELNSVYFDTDQNSPYMSFAPHIHTKYTELLTEIKHLDNTARTQTVTVNDGWIYDLLKEFKRITGYGIIMNTSFNKKGEPLINDLKDALEILNETDLDGIATDKFLILK